MAPYYVASIPVGFGEYNPERTRLSFVDVIYNPFKCQIPDFAFAQVHEELAYLPVQVGNIFRFLEKTMTSINTVSAKESSLSPPFSGVDGNIFFHGNRINAIYTGLPRGIMQSGLEIMEEPFQLDAPSWDPFDMLRYRESVDLPPLVLITSSRTRVGEKRTMEVDLWTNPVLSRNKYRHDRFQPQITTEHAGATFLPGTNMFKPAIGMLRYKGHNTTYNEGLITTVFSMAHSTRLGLTREGEALRDDFIRAIQEDQRSAIPPVFKEKPQDIVFRHRLEETVRALRAEVYDEELGKNPGFTTMMEKLRYWKHLLKHQDRLDKRRRKRAHKQQ